MCLEYRGDRISEVGDRRPLVMHVPDKAMEARARRAEDGAAGASSRHVSSLDRRFRWIRARVLAHHVALCVQNLERDGIRSRPLQASS